MVVGSQRAGAGLCRALRAGGRSDDERRQGPGREDPRRAAPKLTRYYEKVKHYNDLPEILVERIVHFFEHYKDLEPGKWVKIEGLHGPERARELIVDAIERAKTDK